MFISAKTKTKITRYAVITIISNRQDALNNDAQFNLIWDKLQATQIFDPVQCNYY